MPKNRTSISNAETLEEMGEFWDTHDFTDFDTDRPDVEYTLVSGVSVESDLLTALEKQAKLRGVETETLVNLWLKERLTNEMTPQTSK